MWMGHNKSYHQIIRSCIFLFMNHITTWIVSLFFLKPAERIHLGFCHTVLPTTSSTSGGCKWHSFPKRKEEITVLRRKFLTELPVEPVKCWLLMTINRWGLKGDRGITCTSFSAQVMSSRELVVWVQHSIWACHGSISSLFWSLLLENPTLVLCWLSNASCSGKARIRSITRAGSYRTKQVHLCQATDTVLQVKQVKVLALARNWCVYQIPMYDSPSESELLWTTSLYTMWRRPTVLHIILWELYVFRSMKTERRHVHWLS